jgi:WD40 repeat protein
LSLAVLPDYTLASGSYDKTIKIWDTTSGKELKTLNGHTGSVNSLAVLPDNTLASGSDDRTIKIWA